MKLVTLLPICALFLANCFNVVSSFAPRSLCEQRKGLNVLQSSIAGIYDATWQGDHDEELLEFVRMSDDMTRRDDFESFVRGQLQEQKELLKSGYRINDLPFVKSVNDGLIRLGQTVQDEAWEKHVVSGFSETILLQKKQVWACVDMLIQFKILVKNLESKTHAKLMAKKEKGCNGCTECKCKDKKIE